MLAQFVLLDERARNNKGTRLAAAALKRVTSAPFNALAPISAILRDL